MATRVAILTMLSTMMVNDIRHSQSTNVLDNVPHTLKGTSGTKRGQCFRSADPDTPTLGVVEWFALAFRIRLVQGSIHQASLKVIP